jgi:hypothetical protein
MRAFAVALSWRMCRSIAARSFEAFLIVFLMVFLESGLLPIYLTTTTNILLLVLVEFLFMGFPSSFTIPAAIHLWR